MALPLFPLVAAKFALLAYHEEKVEKFLKGIQEKISNSNMPEHRKTFWHNTLTGLIKMMPRKKPIQDTMDYAQDEVKHFFTQVSNTLRELAQELGDEATEISNDITEFFQETKQVLSDKITGARDAVKKALVGLFSQPGGKNESDTQGDSRDTKED